MTLYTDDDVQTGAESLIFAPTDLFDGCGLSGVVDYSFLETYSRQVLDAVLPEYITRLADEIEAKRPCKCTSCSAIKNLIREKASD